MFFLVFFSFKLLFKLFLLLQEAPSTQSSKWSDLVFHRLVLELGSKSDDRPWESMAVRATQLGLGGLEEKGCLGLGLRFFFVCFFLGCSSVAC